MNNDNNVANEFFDSKSSNKMGRSEPKKNIKNIKSSLWLWGGGIVITIWFLNWIISSLLNSSQPVNTKTVEQNKSQEASQETEFVSPNESQEEWDKQIKQEVLTQGERVRNEADEVIEDLIIRRGTQWLLEAHSKTKNSEQTASEFLNIQIKARKEDLKELAPEGSIKVNNASKAKKINQKILELQALSYAVTVVDISSSSINRNDIPVYSLQQKLDKLNKAISVSNNPVIRD